MSSHITPDTSKTSVTLGESAVAFVTATAYFAWCWTIDINPLDRTSQVSGMAALGLRFVLMLLPMIGALVLAAKRWPASFDRVTPYVCAGVAGLSSAMLAGGVFITLRGTPYGLGGDLGDVGVLVTWANHIKAGTEPPALYPPAQIYLLHWISELRAIPAVYAVKTMQLFGLVIFAPLVYLAWRLVLRPIWALAIGITAALPLFEAYRVYPQVVLAVFVPVCLAFLRTLRYADALPVATLARRGVLFGLGFGVMFLVYSGWFQWSAPGLVVAAACVFPWTRAPGKGVMFGSIAVLLFTVVTARYLIGLLDVPPIFDDYMYFDSQSDPAYFAMWRGAMPGPQGLLLWPPLGELGDVGLFTVLLAIGLGTAIALGRQRTVVLGCALVLIGVWIIRFYFASQMWATGNVRLYPRTTAELLYLTLILGAYAIRLALARRRRPPDEATPSLHRDAMIGAICGLSLIYCSVGSAMTNRYISMKDDLRDFGALAWRAHHVPRLLRYAAAARAVASSSLPWSEHLASKANDDDPATWFSSNPTTNPDAQEWIELEFPSRAYFSKVVLTAAAEGFPSSLAAEVWNGKKWIERAAVTLPKPPKAGERVTLSWRVADSTDRVRVRATKLTAGSAGYAFRVAEIAIER